MRKFSMITAALAATLLLAACGGGDDGAGVRSIGDDSSGSASASGSSASGSGSGVPGCEPVGKLSDATTRVNVTLDEWSIVTAVGTAPAGDIGFVIENNGEEPHELVVVKGVTPTALPVDENGALVEDDLPAGAFIGEVEGFPAGETCDGVFALDPGEYTFVCNITEKEDGKVESHLAEGMVTTFTVT